MDGAYGGPRTATGAVPDRAVGWFLAVVFVSNFGAGGVLLWLGLGGPVPLPASAILYLIGLVGPLVGAVVVARTTTGSLAPIRAMLHPVRVGTGFLAAVAVPAALLAGLVAGDALFTDVPFGDLPPVPRLFVLFAVWFVPALVEEVGWRGTLLPALRARYGPLPAAVLVGAVWGLWHLPIHVTGGTDPVGFLLYFVETVGFGIVLAWAYFSTGGVWAPVLAHAAGNAVGLWVGPSVLALPYVEFIGSFAVGMWALAGALLLATGGRLGADN